MIAITSKKEIQLSATCAAHVCHIGYILEHHCNCVFGTWI